METSGAPFFAGEHSFMASASDANERLTTPGYTHPRNGTRLCGAREMDGNMTCLGYTRHGRDFRARRSNGRGTPFGFTLVELLVVIAIIALLVSILLPSLTRAREFARSAVCRAHLKGAGTAVNMYASEFNDFLPGPNTSGLHLTNPQTRGKHSWQDETKTTEPTQNMDWVSPTLGNSLGLPTKRIDRLVQVLNHDMRCPTNKFFYNYEFPQVDTGVPATSIRYASYSAALGFLVEPILKFPNGGRVTEAEVLNALYYPKAYSPQLTKVGPPSKKVYVMEGARYYDSGKGLSFNSLLYQDSGGNFTMWGPVTPMSTGDPIRPHGSRDNPEFGKEADKYAFRHLDNTMNVVHFDGHTSILTKQDSLNTDLWYPDGVHIKNPQKTWDPDDVSGVLD